MAKNKSSKKRSRGKKALSEPSAKSRRTQKQNSATQHRVEQLEADLDFENVVHDENVPQEELSASDSKDDNESKKAGNSEGEQAEETPEEKPAKVLSEKKRSKRRLKGTRESPEHNLHTLTDRAKVRYHFSQLGEWDEAAMLPVQQFLIGPKTGEKGVRQNSALKQVVQKAFGDSLKEQLGVGKGRKLKKAQGSKGSPSLIIISGNARRCTDLIRELKKIESHMHVVKLFAKHMKVAQQQQHLETRVTPAAVGTPARLLQLADAGALKFGNATLVVVDLQRDAKKMNMLDHALLRKDVLALFERHVQPQYERDTLRVCFF
ncbi:MAG: hypothetical protein MHM6MM_001240 [Cercozoa sp. M6MM]